MAGVYGQCFNNRRQQRSMIACSQSDPRLMCRAAPPSPVPPAAQQQLGTAARAGLTMGPAAASTPCTPRRAAIAS